MGDSSDTFLAGVDQGCGLAVSGVDVLLCCGADDGPRGLSAGAGPAFGASAALHALRLCSCADSASRHGAFRWLRALGGTAGVVRS